MKQIKKIKKIKIKRSKSWHVYVLVYLHDTKSKKEHKSNLTRSKSERLKQREQKKRGI